MKILKFYTTFLLLILNSCHSLDKDEYDIINKTVAMNIYPKADQSFITKLMQSKNISFEEASNLADNDVMRENFTFTISDTLYPIKLTKEDDQNLRSKFLFYKIEGRSEKFSIIDFNKINFKAQTKRINKATNDIHYMGYFKLHRVLFDKSKEKALVQIETPEFTNNIFFKKQNGEWIVK